MRQAARLCGLPTALFAVSAFAENLPVGPDLAGLGWRHFEFSGEPANQFSGHEDGIIEVVSVDSISALYMPIAVDLAKTPCLAWSWRVDQAMPANDLRHRDTDDRPISVFVAIPFDAERAGFWERLVRVFVELARGRDAPGRIISYVWGGIGQQGDIQPSPYLQSAGGIVLLRPGEASKGVWFDELVNVSADYQRIFKDPANQPMYVSVLADSDSTNSRAHAFVRDIHFSKECVPDQRN